MKSLLLHWIFSFVLAFAAALPQLRAGEPIVSDSVVFAEQDGMVAIEAEHFFEQSLTDARAFYLTNAGTNLDIAPDGDP
ncbi:hypothetical protein N9N28_17645, partial [Rubripirellula amarantea]|nr:hypothetical protein [Rubripirellula amarantea]